MNHLVNMLHEGFISTVVLVEESRIFKRWSLVGSSCIIEGAAMEGIEVIITDCGCSWEHIVTEEQARPFSSWL